MTKQDIIDAQVSAFQSGELGVLQSVIGAAVDGGISIAPPGSGGGFSQGDIDAAVKSATDPLNSQISDLQGQVSGDAQKLSDALTQAAADLAAAGAKFDALSLKEQGEAQTISKLVEGKADLEGVVSALNAAVGAILNPPAPQPDPSVPASN